MLKKLLSLTLAMALVLSLAGAPAVAADEEAPLRIVVTVFPLYDWVVNLLGDQAERAELVLLLDNGVDLHSYQPTVDDIVSISASNLFLYVGGKSNEWVEDALSEASNPGRLALSMLDVLGDAAKEEETVEGMQTEDEEDDDEIEYDEHVWLSLKNAAVLCRAIADALGELDPEHSALYAANADAYSEQLSALDAAYQTVADAAETKTLLFADRFPFRYLADDYDLNYYAAFSGCSAETEASFETIIFLATKLDELGLSAILQIESADGSIARAVRGCTRSRDQEILTLDSMQSTTRADLNAGVSYLSVMENNLAVLKAALS